MSNEPRPRVAVPGAAKVLRWVLIGLLAAAGIRDPGVSTFAGQVCAPLAPPLRDALAALLAMRWPAAEDELSAADGEAFLRLCRLDSPDFILDRSDYYALFTETLFWGTVG